MRCLNCGRKSEREDQAFGVRRLEIGDDVAFVLTDGRVRAAKAVAVTLGDTETALFTVWIAAADEFALVGDGYGDGSSGFQRSTYERVTPGAALKPGTWHWLEESAHLRRLRSATALESPITVRPTNEGE